MDQGWYGSLAGQGVGYHHTQGWLSQQQDQEVWQGAGVWNHGPYNNEFNGFDGFQNPQYDGAHDSQHDEAQVPEYDGAQDLQYDGLPSEDDEVEEEEEVEEVEEVEEEVERKESGGGHKLSIKSEREYNLNKKARVWADLAEKKKDGAASGAPTDDKGKTYWIGRLFNAFKNTVNIKDKECKSGKPAQSAQRLATTYYPDIEIEKVCWQIFLACVDSSYGVKLVEPHNRTKWETNELHRTFKARMETIIRVLTESKAMCKQLLDPPYYMRLVDAPLFESSLKDNNKKINSERDKQNEIGRKALKKGIDNGVLVTLPNFKTEAEDEEQENARAKAGPQTVTPSRRRTLPAKRRSGTSSKGASSRQNEPTPVTTGKRKQRATGAKNYREISDGEDAEDDSDVSLYENDGDSAPPPHTPKRAATNTAKAKGSTPVGTSTRKSRPKPAAAKLPVREQAQSSLASGTRNRRTTLSSVVNASDVEEDQKMKFKETICKILQVDKSFAESYSLEELRFYARAYNVQFATDDWQLSMGNAELATCKMQRVITSKGIIHHFAHVLPKFCPLAIARGDLNPDSTVNFHSRYMSGFSTDGDVHEDQALGVLPNPFGLHDQLWNLPPQ